MPAVTREAILRKQANRKSKKDIERELKIKELGGEALDIKYGTPLTRAETDVRMEYMYDLMYPSRLLPKEDRRGAPRKYANAEERREAQNIRSRELYRKRRGGTIRQHEKLPCVEDHRYTPWYSIYMNSKVRAKKLNVPFNLTIEHIKEEYEKSTVCPFLNINMVVGTKDAPSIDRIIPSLGYTIGNVQIISKRANLYKNDSTFEEFERMYLSWKLIHVARDDPRWSLNEG